ncbi:ABC transporter ATP-binding protein, partial [Streptomyces sp. NPDC059142]|uniref:ABC transporter ATP-binding protein n=1 Tax=Streptomyces sp. NPDC059142 TaxID=3346739 RepID=UPI0036A3DC48
MARKSQQQHQPQNSQGSQGSHGQLSSPPAPPSRSGSAQSPVLQLQDLTRVHGSGATEVHALRGINLDVFPGELVAVMGPSGSGKSTLLTIAGGLDLPTSGRVLVEGTDITTADRKELAAMRRRSVGYVFQDYNLIPALTAAENIALPRELDGVSARKARVEALAALREIGLDQLADRFPDEMSGGQQQRIALCRALVGDRRRGRAGVAPRGRPHPYRGGGGGRGPRPR